MPESYPHDSSEEKLYSKYTDVLLAVGFRRLGLESIVLTERADAADVEVAASSYSFVADAKAFRLSRTAKNQKDFKVQALDGWRGSRRYAVVVAPLYQLPARSSQIYQQAIARDVCVLSYSHLAVLVALADEDQRSAQETLTRILEQVVVLPPTKDAIAYWTAINRAMLNGNDRIQRLWALEKLASTEALSALKEEAIAYLSNQRDNFMRLTREQAIALLIDVQRIDSRMSVIRAIGDNGLMEAI